MLLLYFPFSENIFLLSLAIICAIGIYIVVQIVKQKYILRIEIIFEIGIIIGYVASSFAHAVINIIIYGHVKFTENDFGLQYSQEDISHCMIIILLCTCIINFIGKINNFKNYYTNIESCIDVQSICCIVLSCIITIYALFSGDLGYMGTSKTIDDRISPLGALCYAALPPLTILSIIHTTKLPKNYRKYKFILITTSIIFIFALIPMGRRVLMYTFILLILIQGHKILNSMQKFHLKHLYIVISILIVAIFNSWCFQTFYAMRIAIAQYDYQENQSIATIAQDTHSLLTGAYTHAKIQEELIDNISTRPFILSYLAALLAAHQDNNTPLFGELLHAIAISMPSAVNPLKTYKLTSSTEEFTHPSLNINIFDGPNTIFTAGLNDLKYFGILLYPILIMLIYILLIFFIPKKIPEFIKKFIIIKLSYSLLYFEDDLNSMIGSGLRDTLLISIIYYTFYKFFEIKQVSN